MPHLYIFIRLVGKFCTTTMHDLRSTLIRIDSDCFWLIFLIASGIQAGLCVEMDREREPDELGLPRSSGTPGLWICTLDYVHKPLFTCSPYHRSLLRLQAYNRPEGAAMIRTCGALVYSVLY
jgi:hypothetical protein